MINRFIYHQRKLIRPSIVQIHNVRIRIGDHISENVKNFIYSGFYEGEELTILSKVIRPTDKILEVGTGLGLITVYCAQIIGSENIVTFEANPYLIEKAKENFDINGVNPEIRNAILSDSVSKVDFFIEEGFWSSSTTKRSDAAKIVQVKTANTKDILLELRPNFIIMDIEGGEKDLIYKIDFNSIEKLLIEIHPQIIGNTQATKIIAFLYKKGFELVFEISKGFVFYFIKSVEA